MNKALLLIVAFLLLPVTTAYVDVVDSSARTFQVQEGNVLEITYTIQSDQLLGRVESEILLPQLINHKDTSQVFRNIYTYQEQFLLPHTLPKYPVQVKVKPVGQQATYLTLPLTEQQTTQQAQQILQTPVESNDLTIVVKPTIDVMQGAAIYYPITLANDGSEPITLMLGVRGARMWATYQVLPQPTITLEPEEQMKAYVYFATDSNAPTGMQHFTITAQYNGVTEETPIALAVLKPVETYDKPEKSINPWIVILIVLIIVIIAIVLRMSQKGEEDELITYY